MRAFQLASVHSLTHLTIGACLKLQSLPPNLPLATALRHLTIGNVESIVSLEPLSALVSLERLEVSSAMYEERFPEVLFALPSLAYVKMGCVLWVEADDVAHTARNYSSATAAAASTATPVAAAALAATGGGETAYHNHSSLGPCLEHLSFRVASFGDGWRRGTISPHLCSLLSLTHLSIDGLYSSVSLPSNQGHLSNLRSLSLRGNWLGLPQSLSRLAPCLHSLKLHYSKYNMSVSYDRALPSFLTDLTSLTHLHLHNIHLPTSLSGFAPLRALRTLRIECDSDIHTRVSLPEDLDQLATLEWLELRGCYSIDGIPQSLCDLASLRRLFLDTENLEHLPGAISKLSRLEELNVYWCHRLETLPPGFGHLRALKKLSIDGGSNDFLPDTLADFSSLEEVSLAYCSYDFSLPPSFCLLPRLLTLTLTYCNDLTTLPAGFGSLCSLQRLSVDSCKKFHHLPDSFSSLPALTLLSIVSSYMLVFSQGYRQAAPPSPSRPPATTAAAAAARATAAAGGGAAGSAGSAAGAGGAGPTTDCHYLSWPLSRQLQRLGVDSGGHYLSRTTPPLSSFASGQQQSQQETFSPQLLSELVLQRCVTGSVEAAALGASESAAALGASESAAALGASESAAALGASESAAAPDASESAAALGARASPATGPSSAEALQTFTLDSGASRCFFRDCTTLIPLAALVPVSLADPTGGPVVARASTVLPCPAFPSDSLSGLHLPMFSANLTGRQLAKFTRRPGSSLYTLTTASAQTLLWHHRLGHPSLPRLRSMHSRLLVSGLPRSMPSLSRSPAPPCLPCVEGRQRAAPNSSEFPPTTAPLQTLHMDVWGPAPVGGTDQERYVLLVVDEYTRYTNVFPLRRKANVSGVLIPLIRATCRQLRKQFSRDFPVLHEGIHQSFMLPPSPQQNGIAERRIGLIMEVARTSMIHAAAPHFLWLFAVRYAAHQLNLWPCVSEPETSPTLQWMGKVGDASVFCVWGALSFVRDAKASKLSSCTLCCVFLGFPTDTTSWQFYHPHERQVFSSQDVTFDESVCFYRLHPHASHPVPLV
ncbi:unnamed protein product [Closterium sp. NIES-54]